MQYPCQQIYAFNELSFFRIVFLLLVLVLIKECDGVVSDAVQQVRGPGQLGHHGPQLPGELLPVVGELGLLGQVGQGLAALPRLLTVELIRRHARSPVNPGFDSYILKMDGDHDT